MRYIDADKLKADIKEITEITDGKLTEFEALGILSGQPTADVVEVVRCKDCRWKQGAECVRFADVRPFPDDFCSRGERKEE